jgi:hypothetical protein
VNYPRYKYLEPGVPTVKVQSFFPPGEFSLPKFDYPITPAENLKRSANRDKPRWVPNPTLDFQYIQPNNCIAATEKTKGLIVGLDFTRLSEPENWTFRDWFGADWTFVVSAGGPMLTPGTQVLDDITRWETGLKFPDLTEWDFETAAVDYMKNSYDPAKALCADIGLGCTERLVSVMGGYTDALVALATEPEAITDFFNAFVDHEIEQFDKLYAQYPLNMLTYHDDWGNEKDTFFSPKMLEELILEPTRRFISHVKSKGVAFEFHSCGNITRFVPYFIDIGVDFMQSQRRVVDFPRVKAQYDDKIGFSGIEGLDFGAPTPPKDKLLSLVRNSVDLLASKGGYYASIPVGDPELNWLATNELYAYSREFYDKTN